jgi:hypothetical protein
VPAFVIAQLVGGACAVLAIRVLYPDVTPAGVAEVVIPHQQSRGRLQLLGRWACGELSDAQLDEGARRIGAGESLDALLAPVRA